ISKVREIYQVTLKKLQVKDWLGSQDKTHKEIWSLRIVANGFLQKMVRMIMGFLIEIGQEKKTLEQWRQVLAGKKLKQAKLVAPPQGLCLTKIKYKENI
ncbi:MAG: hypothetical protein KKA19_05900, partial [Candidatus Margulisbacteria bacterium]|nr:hypothetical protein [Candidatus Margulisiibacteriota bacterium]